MLKKQNSKSESQIKKIEIQKFKGINKFLLLKAG